MNKKFSIILVNYNNWDDTIECIKSLLEENIEPGWIIVVENGSKNDSAFQLERSFIGIKLLKSETNLGFSGGNNLGIEYALREGFEYIILLNNDTIVSSGAIDTLIKNMDTHPGVSLGTGQIRCLPDKDKIWYAGGKLIPWRGLAVHKNFGEKYTATNPNKATETDFISGCYLCIRSSHIKKLGMLNDKFFIYLEDIEYSARAVKNGLKLMFFPDSIIYHKWRGEADLKNNTLYYAVRNRLLLIDLVFPKIAKFYFLSVISIKLLIWYFTNRLHYQAAIRGLKDYKKNYFGAINH